MKKSGPTTAEQLAFIEAHSKGNGWDLFDFEKVLSETPNAKVKIEKILRKYDLKQGLSKFESGELIELLYRVSNPETGTIRGVLKNGANKEVHALIKRRAEVLLATEELSMALSELGLLRKNSSLENFRVWRRKNSAIESGAISMVMNTVIIAKVGPFVSVPELKALLAKSLDPAVIAEVKEAGFEKVLLKLQKEWGLAAKIQLTTSGLEKVIRSIYLGVFGYYLVTEFPAIKATLGALFTSKQDVIDLQKQDSADDIRKRQFESWVEGYEEIKGSKLDTVNVESDRMIAREQWKILNSISDEELRIK